MGRGVQAYHDTAYGPDHYREGACELCLGKRVLSKEVYANWAALKLASE